MSRKKHLSVSFLGLLALAFVMQSCLKEYKNTDKISKTTDYNPSVAIALAKGRLTVRDIIRDYDMDELFQEGSDGSLFLNYNKKVFSQTAEEVVKFNDQHFPKVDLIDKTIYDLIPAQNGYKTFPTIPLPNPFGVNNDEKLEKIIFDTLDLVITINSSFNMGGNLKIEFPSLKTNGVAELADIELDNSGNFHQVYTKRLVNCELIFEGDSNNILANLDLIMEDGIANSSDVIDVEIQMNNLDFRAIYGYVGHITAQIPQDTVEVSSFKNAFSGEIWLRDPSITLYIENSFGLPISSYFGDLQTYTLHQNGVSGSSEGTWQSFPFPQEYIGFAYPTSIGEVKKDTLVFNKNNFPILPEIISKYPKYFLFEVDSAVINQNGYDESLPNFVLDTSKIGIDMNIKMPLAGNARYSLVDTFDISMGDNFDEFSKYFVEANLRMIFDNALPTNVYAQVVFLDSILSPIDTLFEGGSYGNRLINSAVIDNSGRVQQSTKTVNDILFGNGANYEHNINDLKNARKVVIIATLKTNEEGLVGADAPIVNFFGENYLELRLGIKGTVKYEETLK